jgi:NADPH2:quinone reductase
LRKFNMKAAWYTQTGEAHEVMVVGTLPTPSPQAGEVRVKLTHSGVNPSDVKSRKSRPVTDPLIIPHSDGAGVIDAVGEGVDRQRIGQRVWVWNGQWQRAMGTACEYICLPQAQAVALPDHIEGAAAACFGIPALTAIQAIHLAPNLCGKTVLITGAASGVGHYVTQLAKLEGARVLGTVGSESRAQHAQNGGCDEVIFYKTEAVAQRVLDLTQGHGVDVIVDLDFASTSALLPQGALKHHGTLVGYGSNNPSDVPVHFRTLLWGSLNLRFFLVYDLLPADRQIGIDRLTQLLQGQLLQHSVGATYPLAEVVKAHQAVEQGQLVGQVVLTI